MSIIGDQTVVVLDNINKTVCYDLYFDQAFDEKNRRYAPLCELLEANGYSTKLVCVFGSLGSIKTDVWSGLRYF